MGLFDKLFAKKPKPAMIAINSNADFWEWFRLNEKDFFNVVKKEENISELFFDKISPRLDEIKEGFFYITGMYDDTTAELILTADANMNNIAFVEDLVAAAPLIKGWKFTALKQEHEIENATINMAGYKFDESSLSFYATEHKDYPDEISIT